MNHFFCSTSIMCCAHNRCPLMPVCIVVEPKKKKEKKKPYYKQKCYANNTIFGLSEGHEIPGKKKIQTSANCGCCPSDEMIPDGISKVKGRRTPVCDGAQDCAAAGVSDTIISNWGKKVFFETCINEEAVFAENFALPSAPNDTIKCGPCIDCEAVLMVNTGFFGSDIGWQVTLNGEVIDSGGPGIYFSESSYVENLAFPENCYNDCYEVVITDTFGDGPNGVSQLRLSSFLHDLHIASVDSTPLCFLLLPVHFVLYVAIFFFLSCGRERLISFLMVEIPSTSHLSKKDHRLGRALYLTLFILVRDVTVATPPFASCHNLVLVEETMSAHTELMAATTATVLLSEFLPRQ